MAIVRGVNESSVVNYVVSKFNDWKEARKAKEIIWTECTRMYLSKLSDQTLEWAKKNSRSRRPLASGWDAVDTVHAQLMMMLLPGDSWLKLMAAKPGGFEDDDLAAKHLTSLLHNQHRHSGFKNNWSSIVKQLLICGSCPSTTLWDTQWAVDYPAYAMAMAQYEQQNAMDWQEYQMMMQQFQMAARQAVAQGADPESLPKMPGFRPPGPPPADMTKAYEGPYIEIDDLFNFVQDPFPNRKQGALRIKKTWKTRAYLERFTQPDETGYRVYENLENVHDSMLVTSRTVTDSQLAERAAAFDMDLPNDMKGVELLEGQGDMEIPLGGSGYSLFVNYIATIANDVTLIRFEPGYLWVGEPSTQLATIGAPPGEIYGIGILEMARGTKDLMDVRVNQLVDVVAAVINPEYKCIDDGIIDVEAVSRPGKRHIVGNMKNLEMIQKDFKGIQIGMADLGTLKAEFQQITRSSNASVSMNEKTATEIQRDAGVSSASMQQMVADIEGTSLQKSVEHEICLNAQYTNSVVMAHQVQDSKTSWLPVSPEQIRRGWLVQVMGSRHVAERDKRLQDLMFFNNMTLSNPATVPFVRILQLLKMTWEQMGFQNPDQIFVDEQTGTALLMEMMKSGALVPGLGQGQGQPGGNLGAKATGGGPAGGAVNQESGDPIFNGQTGLSGSGVQDVDQGFGGGIEEALRGIRA